MKRVGGPSIHSVSPLLLPEVSSSGAESSDGPLIEIAAPAATLTPVPVARSIIASDEAEELQDFIADMRQLSWRVDYLRIHVTASATPSLSSSSSNEPCTTDEGSPSTHSGCSAICSSRPGLDGGECQYLLDHVYQPADEEFSETNSRRVHLRIPPAAQMTPENGLVGSGSRTLAAEESIAVPALAARPPPLPPAAVSVAVSAATVTLQRRKVRVTQRWTSLQEQQQQAEESRFYAGKMRVLAELRSVIQLHTVRSTVETIEAARRKSLPPPPPPPPPAAADRPPPLSMSLSIPPVPAAGDTVPSPAASSSADHGARDRLQPLPHRLPRSLPRPLSPSPSPSPGGEQHQQRHHRHHQLY